MIFQKGALKIEIHPDGPRLYVLLNLDAFVAGGKSKAWVRTMAHKLGEVCGKHALPVEDKDGSTALLWAFGPDDVRQDNERNRIA